MRLKNPPFRADSTLEATAQGECIVFKIRRRSVAETVASDLPFCGMCGTVVPGSAAPHEPLELGAALPPEPMSDAGRALSIRFSSDIVTLPYSIGAPLEESLARR